MNSNTASVKEAQTFLSRSHTGMLRGLAILLIMTVHFCNGYTHFKYLTLFAGAGVAVFLIISGYGINESYKKKGFDKFWRDKLVKIYLPCLAVFLVFYLIKKEITALGLLKGIVLIGLQASWYIQFLFILYFLFYVTAKLLKEKRIYFWLVFPFLFIFVNNHQWAEQAATFTLGILASQYSIPTVYEKIKKSRLALILLGLFAVTGAAYLVRGRLPDGGMWYVADNVAHLFFKTSMALEIIILTQLVKTRFTTAVFGFIGSISFALYLLHLNIFELLLSDGYSAVRLAVTLVITFAASYLYTKLINLLYKSIKRRHNHVEA